MTTIRRIVTSQVDGNDANTNNDNEIRPFGETAFYLEQNGPVDKPVLAIHDGVRTHIRSKVLGPGVLYGSNADAGDGSNADTIKLIPDALLYDQGSNQYVVVDPTGGEPGHIHLRAGGTQDASSADLFLGGELTNVRVSDTSDNVRIRTTNVGDPNITLDWTFEADGNLYFPGTGNNRIGESEPGLVVSSDNSVVLQSNNNGESAEWTFNTTGDLTFPNNAVIRTDGNNLEVGGVNNFNVEAGGVVNVYTATDSVTPFQWQFGDNGDLTLPGSGAVLGWGGASDTNSLNINIPDSADPGNVTHQFAFDASYGFPALRFPDGTFQTTALKAETIAQVGYQLMFDTDIYANETGGVLDPYETSVFLESNAQVRALFQVEAFATSTTARAYNHPTNYGEIVLEVASVIGAPVDPSTSVWAIIDGTPTPVGDIQSQIGDTTWVLIGVPLLAEIVLGTEFEFYASGFPSYSPRQTIILEWDDGTETEVVEGKTNNPYGLSIQLVTAEDQTTLSYPMILTTADYTPSEFSHVIDADNDFKITTRANDFIINSNEGPLVIRNASSEYLFEGGTLTVPGTINIEGVGSVVGFATGEDNFIGLEGQANWGVALRATDSQLDSKNWLFGVDGNLTLPGELHGAPVMSVGPTPSQVGRTVNITPADDADDKKFRFRIDQYAEQLFTRAYLELPEAEVDKQVAAVFPHANGKAGYIFTQGADTIDDGLNNAFNVFYNAGDIKLTAMTPVTGTLNTWKFGSDGNLTLPDDGVVSAGGSGGLTLGGNFDVKIIADYTDNDRTWSFNGTDGSLTFPDSTVQETAWAGGRVVAVPTSSLGTTGDLQGDLAFNATYMYYCTQNFSGTVINMTSISSSGSSNSYIIMYTSNAGWTSDDLTGYTVTGPSGYTGTVTGPSQDQGGNLWYIPVSPNVTQAIGTYTFTSPGGNIWKRIAWSGDTW